MNWTSEKPKEPGWYWWRNPRAKYEEDREVTIYKVRNYVGDLAIGNCRIKDSHFEKGLWLGPISPDDRQQGRVEGAQEYRDAVIQELHLDDAARQEFTRTDVVLALAHADEQLAQQAQGGVGDDLFILQ